MKVCSFTIISSPAPEICLSVPLIGDVLYTERVFLYCHNPMEHRVILVGSILRYFRGLWSVSSVNLLQVRYSLKRLLVIPHTTARHSFSR